MFKRTKHIWKNDEESYLGFLCINFFKSRTDNFGFDDILKANLLSDKYDKSISEIENSPLKYEGFKNFGPIDITLLKKDDFDRLNFFQLSAKIEAFWENHQKGDDWPIFKKHWGYLKKELAETIIKSNDFYYINSKNLRDELIPQENFFSYFIGSICIERESRKVITFYFGAD
nr:hypothetical protein [uncultured Allomuricauda sp.]